MYFNAFPVWCSLFVPFCSFALAGVRQETVRRAAWRQLGSDGAGGGSGKTGGYLVNGCRDILTHFQIHPADLCCDERGVGVAEKRRGGVLVFDAENYQKRNEKQDKTKRGVLLP